MGFFVCFQFGLLDIFNLRSRPLVKGTAKLCFSCCWQDTLKILCEDCLLSKHCKSSLQFPLREMENMLYRPEIQFVFFFFNFNFMFFRSLLGESLSNLGFVPLQSFET